MLRACGHHVLPAAERSVWIKMYIATMPTDGGRELDAIEDAMRALEGKRGFAALERVHEQVQMALGAPTADEEVLEYLDTGRRKLESALDKQFASVAVDKAIMSKFM